MINTTFNLLAKAFGLQTTNESQIESITHIDGEYFVLERGKTEATGVDKKKACELIKTAGGNPESLDRLP